jgi:hypothetical protein
LRYFRWWSAIRNTKRIHKISGNADNLIFCQKLNCPQNSFTCSKKHFKNVSFLTCLHPHPMSTLRVGNYAKLLNNIHISDFLKKSGFLFFVNFIGNPKQPTISVCNLIDQEYQISKFRDHERIIYQTFPELDLTGNQIFKAYI